LPLSWNEIKDRALRFSREWATEASERAEAQTFWNEFFEVFGITRRRVASFEEPVRNLQGERQRGFIDLFWKGVLIAEHKSRGERLDPAYTQALDYFPGILERDLPRFVMVSDFARMRLRDLESGEEHEFTLTDLHRNVQRFWFIAGYRPQIIRPEDPVNLKAAEKMGRLHDQLKAAGYEGHALEVLLVRLLFCLFADDTGIFPTKDAFREWVETRTNVDGSDLGPQLALVFQVLNTVTDRRPRTLDEQIAAFPYVDGRLFEETLPIATFTRAMREALLDCCGLDWSKISPAIFGALFQAIMNEKARRNLGAHYTSEQNILKVIKPLFLDALCAEFERVRGNRNRLKEFHNKLRSLTFMDPACGCGNFLVVAYRELRKLELEILRAMQNSGQRVLDVRALLLVDVDQFYGIEIEEFPVQIAQVALWLTDHQMNQMVGQEFGQYFARIPLQATPHILHGNALRVDWEALVPRDGLSYVFGNPPFVGKQYQSDEQKADLGAVFGGARGTGVLDLVAGWYIKAANLVRGSSIRCAFVSTNSISQGEQVGVLWSQLLPLGMHIHFAHRTFRWRNEARGVAAVHCVIIGFGAEDLPGKVIYDYQDLGGEAHATAATNINPYLVDAADVLLPKRREPICAVRPMAFGSMPNDGGHLILSEDERTALLHECPQSRPWVRVLLGSEEFINGTRRYCLWLVGASPQELRQMRPVMERVEMVRQARLESKRPTTQELADIPALFGEIRQPTARYIAIPEVSSVNRQFVPMDFLPPDTIATNKLYTVDGGGLYEIGVLESSMHMAWTRSVTGRLKSDYQYSAGIVYNNFPWPIDSTAQQRAAVAAAAQEVLDARARHQRSSLADLYDPLSMPPELVRAHQALDRVVDAAYVPSGGRRTYTFDADRMAFLFGLYQRITTIVPASSAPRGRRRRAR
jgi:hypothetical protein